MLVGAGAGGVEMAFACRASLPSVVPIKLVGPTLLPGLNRRAKKLVGKAMREKRIEYIAQRVTSASETQNRYRITLTDGSAEEACQLLWVTNVRAPEWLAESVLFVMIKALPKSTRQ